MHKGRSAFLALATFAILLLAGCSGSSTSSTSSELSSSSTASSAVTIYPGSPTVSLNQTINFSAYLPSSPNSTFTWSVTGGGAINSSTGTYTAPATAPSGTVTVTATSTSTGGSSATGTTTISVVSAQGVALSPGALAIKAGGVQVFTSTPAATIWEVNGTQGGDSVHGTISSNGTYIAPPVPPPGGSTTITAVTGSASGTATATILFSNNSLNGSYAYSYTGDNSSGYLAVAGSFTAQGSGGTGNIVNGLEEAVGPGSAAQAQFTGTFSVNPDGSATATLSNGAVWQLALVANTSGTASQHAPLIRFDKNATGSGSIDLQNPVFLSASAFSGNYVFGVSGPDPQGRPLAIAGRFFSDGIDTIVANASEEDINYNGTNTFATSDTSLQGSFALDPVHGNINGDGTLTLTTTDSSIFETVVNTSTSTTTTSFQYEFFIVDNTHIKVVEIDKNFALAGDFYSAANGPAIGSFNAGNTLPAGKYAFTLGGQSNSGAYALGGVITSSGSNSTSGSVTGGVLDINDGAFNIQLDNNLTGTSYTIDSALGRITIPFVVKTQNIDVALYGASYSSANGPVEVYEMIELDNNVASGLAYPQTSTVSSSTSYAVDLAGVANAGGNAVKQDFVGQMTTIFGTSSLQGVLNCNNFGQSTLSPNATLSATNIVAVDANGRGTLTINASNGASFPLAYYVSSNGVLFLETDLARVATGSAIKQF